MAKSFTDDEEGLICEALYDLLDVKTTAMNTLNETMPIRNWTPQDFGIPTILELIRHFEHDEPVNEEFI